MQFKQRCARILTEKGTLLHFEALDDQRCQIYQQVPNFLGFPSLHLLATLHLSCCTRGPGLPVCYWLVSHLYFPAVFSFLYIKVGSEFPSSINLHFQLYKIFKNTQKRNANYWLNCGLSIGFSCCFLREGREGGQSHLSQLLKGASPVLSMATDNT